MKIKEKKLKKDKNNCSDHVCATVIEPCPEKCPNSCQYRSKFFVLFFKISINSYSHFTLQTPQILAAHF